MLHLSHTEGVENGARSFLDDACIKKGSVRKIQQGILLWIFVMPQK